MRLAIFVDQVFWSDGQVLSTDEAYLLFFRAFLGRFDELVFVGRLAPEPGRMPYQLGPGMSLRPLPFYDGVAGVWRAGRRLFGAVRELVRREGRGWDAALICGPNPVAQAIGEACAAEGVPLALVVRQNLVPQVARTNSGLRRVLAVAYAQWLELRFRRLAAGRAVFAVGDEMTTAYGRVTRHAHNHFACLISDAQLAQFAAVGRTPAPGRLICVGRLSAEKGHRFLLEAMALVVARGGDPRLDIVGSGPLEGELRRLADGLGLGGRVAFHGYVPYGPELFALYAGAEALVVPSLQEGFPQVINEALCVGLPVVASAVGGIPGALRDGETALLVAPGDPTALAAALARVGADGCLRARLEEQGRALMRANTLEANRDRIMQVLYDHVLPSRG